MYPSTKMSLLPKFHLAPEKLPPQWERIVFQPSIFRGFVEVFNNGTG